MAHDHVMLLCMLTITININDIPATKITGLNTIATRLPTLNIFASHESQALRSNTFIKTRNGDHMINIHKSHTLMMLAIKSNKSAIVNRNNKKNLRANPSVRLMPELLSVLR
ncbi:MAG: hypothetical protein WCL18_10100 [bacterium]